MITERIKNNDVRKTIRTICTRDIKKKKKKGISLSYSETFLPCGDGVLIIVLTEH